MIDVIKNLEIAATNNQGVFEKDGKLWKIVSLSQPACEVIEVDAEDEFKTILKCPNCGKTTEFGNTRMISGIVGCDNTTNGRRCYFDDLMPRILNEHKKKEGKTNE